MSTNFEFAIQFESGQRGRRIIRRSSSRPAFQTLLGKAGRTPRISRLMALAIRFEQQISTGELRNYAQIARLGRVTRARVTQIMSLLRLAPDIQMTLLNLPPVARGRDPLTERQMRPITNTPDWHAQRVLFMKLMNHLSS